MPGYLQGHVKSVYGATSGKWFVESVGLSGPWAVGIVRSDVAVGVDIFSDPRAIIVYGAGIYSNGVVIGSISGTNIVGFEFDSDTGQVWVRHPGGRAGPFSISPLGGGQSYTFAAQSGDHRSFSVRINAGQDIPSYYTPTVGFEQIFGDFS